MRAWHLGVLAAFAAGALILALAAFDSGDDPAPPPAGPAGSGSLPNIVVVMTDDQGLSTLERGTPRARAAVVAEGTELTEAIVTTPLCCPSRASFLSGQYGHNNGVLENDPGYPRLRGKRNVLPVWLRRAGYRTALVGKFLNGYDRTARGRARRPAPGWDEWTALERTYAYYDYELNQDGRRVRYGSRPSDYLTRVLTGRALRSVRRLRSDERPLFLWLAHWAPHTESAARTPGRCRGSAMPPSRSPGEFAEARLPGAAESIDEPDAADKPRFIRERRRFKPRDRERARIRYRCALASLAEVDRSVAELRAELERLGELERTVFVFTSDNGFLFGEHRLVDGKGVPYEEAIRVPLLIDLPPSIGPQPDRVDAQVANIDLAPTLLELAGGRPCAAPDRCRRLDGRSLVPLLRGRSPAAFAGRELLVEAEQGKPCPFRAVRGERYSFVTYPRRGPAVCRPLERTLYDLEADRAQLDNLLADSTPGPPAGIADRLAARLRELRRCAGAGAGGRSC